MIDVEGGNQRIQSAIVHSAETVGGERKRAVIGAGCRFLVMPIRPTVACRLMPAAEGGGGADTLIQRGGRNQAGSVDGDHSTCHWATKAG
jgi:hypothetical protein